MVKIRDFWRTPPTAKIDELSRFSPASMFTIGYFIARRRLKPTRSDHQFETGCLSITLGGHYHSFKTRLFRSPGAGAAHLARVRTLELPKKKKNFCMQSGSSAILQNTRTSKMLTKKRYVRHN